MAVFRGFSIVGFPSIHLKHTILSARVIVVALQHLPFCTSGSMTLEHQLFASTSIYPLYGDVPLLGVWKECCFGFCRVLGVGNTYMQSNNCRRLHSFISLLKDVGVFMEGCCLLELEELRLVCANNYSGSIHMLES